MVIKVALCYFFFDFYLQSPHLPALHVCFPVKRLSFFLLLIASPLFFFCSPRICWFLFLSLGARQPLSCLIVLGEVLTPMLIPYALLLVGVRKIKIENK